MSNTCRGLAGFLFGHNYQPRTTRQFPENVTGVKTDKFCGSSGDYVRMLDAWKNAVYHGDVCTRCGHTVNVPIKK